MANFKEKMRNFMSTRNGPDNLSMMLIGCGLFFTVLSLFLSRVSSVASSVLSTVGFLCMILCIFRMFSSNREKRREENRRYIVATEKVKTEIRQAKVRFKNRKQYKYFKCPNCKIRMRLRRGSGVVTVTCSRCHSSFTQKS